MDLRDVRQIKVRRKKRRRVGRGQGSGWGTTSGRGHKGAGQRSGNVHRLHFEGGQMPLYRRLPKKGFSNAVFKLRFHVVNVGDLDSRFDAGAVVDLDTLRAAGLAPKKAKFLKILGWGEVSKKMDVRAHAVSAGARTKIESAGGTIDVLPTRATMRPRGVKKAASTAGDTAADSGSAS
jgi:large subunit ribosomal protein L15